MNKPTRWQIFLTSMTLSLVACQDSITGIPDPVVELAPPVEAVTAIAMTHGGCVAPAANLVSWWPGDGDFDDILGLNSIDRVSQDGSGNNSVTFEPGLVAQAFGFTGMVGQPNQYLEIDDAADLQPLEFTVEFWAKRLGDGQGSAGGDLFGSMLIQKAISDVANASSGLSYYISWRVNSNGDPQIVADVAFDTSPLTTALGPRLVSPAPSVDVSNGVWVHVALTVEGSTATLYVNGGDPVTFSDPAGGTPTYGSGSIAIGNNWSWARTPPRNYNRGFNGLIDELDLFGGALEPGDIQAIYNAGSGGKCKTPEPVAPVVDAGPDGSIDEGSTFESTASFTDDDSGAWTAEVNYGDGTEERPTVSGTSFDLSHKYAQDGVYTVKVTVTDDAGAKGSSSATVTVNNVDPVVDAGPDATIFEGSTFESAGSFTDPGADSWTATVDYGDGSGTQALELTGKTFALSHMYADQGSGPFTLTVSVQDDHNAGVGLMLLTVDAAPEDDAEVTVVYPITIDRATVRLGKGNWWEERGRDTYAVDGRLPLSLLERFDPYSEELTIELDGLEQVVIPAGSFVRKDDKWKYKGSRRASGVVKIDLHDDGRFKIHMRGPYGFRLPDVDFTAMAFSLWFGPDIGEAVIQLDRKLRFRSHDGDDYDDDDADGDDWHADWDDDDDDDDRDRDHKKKKDRRGPAL